MSIKQKNWREMCLVQGSFDRGACVPSDCSSTFLLILTRVVILHPPFFRLGWCLVCDAVYGQVELDGAECVGWNAASSRWLEAK